MGNSLVFGASLNEIHRRQTVKIIESFKDQLDSRDINTSEIDFENLVLEGGGVKGIAYAGMYQALSDLGILHKLKRFAGASIGSLYAVMGAIGLSSEEITEHSIYCMKNLKPGMSPLSFLPNILTRFGWNAGENIRDFVHQILQDKQHDPEITFTEFYKKTGKELCIVVTNVSSMRIEYCHVKTTPDLPIYKAVLMSMALPLVYQPIIYSKQLNHEEYYSDGGILLNYPINAFDGWYLSLKKEHSFLHMIDSPEAPFGQINNKSIGAILFDIEEPELSKEIWLKWQNSIPKRPETRLMRKRKSMLEKNSKITIERSKVSEAAKVFLKVLAAADKSGDGQIDIDELRVALDERTVFTNDHWVALFGQERDIDAMFQDIDLNNDGNISYDELIWFIQKKGVTLLDGTKSFFACNEIGNISDFFAKIYSSIEFNLRANIAKKSDEERTIPIYTDYLKTTDFDLEMEDQKYIINLGYRATIEFIKDKYRKK